MTDIRDGRHAARSGQLAAPAGLRRMVGLTQRVNGDEFDLWLYSRIEV